MKVVGLSGSVTEPQGFRTTHQAGGSEYEHEFRVVEDPTSAPSSASRSASMARPSRPTRPTPRSPR